MSAEPASTCRLLAYGGTGDWERRRIGDWPDVGTGALSDLWGLPSGEGRFQFGCGILGGAMALIFRERQCEEDRSGRAYTLLIDPGEANWRRFGWNAALLMLSFAEGASPLLQLLRFEPEKLTAEALSSLLDSLEPVPPPSGSRQAAAAAAALARSALSGAGEGVGSIPLPDDLLRSPGSIAATIGTLPVCFRSAWGWLAGGSAANASSFGSRLAFPRGSDSTPTAPRHWTEAPSSFQQALDLDALRHFVKELESTPIHLWTSSFGENPIEVIARLEACVRLGDPAELPADREEPLSAILRSGGLLVPELRTLLSNRLGRCRAGVDPVTLRIAVEEALQGRIDPGTLLESASEEIVAGLLAERRLPPGTTPFGPGLGVRSHQRIWAAILADAANRQRLPALISSAVQDVLSCGGSRKQRMSAAEELFQSAIARLLALGGDLAEWTAHPWGSAVAGIARHCLSKAVKAPGATAAAGRPVPAGSWYDLTDVPLAGVRLRPGEAREILLDLLLGGGPGLDDGRSRRLAEMAALRPRLTSDAVRQVSMQGSSRHDAWPRLARRFGPRLGEMEAVLRRIGDASRGFVTAIARGAGNRFATLAEPVYREAAEALQEGRPVPRSAVAKAVAQTLLMQDQAENRADLLRNVHGGADREDERFLRWIASGVDPAASISPARGRRAPRRSWFARLRAFFGFRSG